MNRRVNLFQIRNAVAFVALLMLFSFALQAIVAQSATADRKDAVEGPSFDVVSVHPVTPNSAEIAEFGWDKNMFYLRNMPLTVALSVAFFDRGTVPSGFTSSLPSWVREERYDLTAKMSTADYELLKQKTGQAIPSIPMEMLHPMLQKMLKERCNLAVHHASAVKTGFSLEVGKNGINPKRMKESMASESLPSDAHNFGGVWFSRFTGSEDHQNDKRDFYKMTMSEFASHIGSATRVTDHTGLSARYDFTVELIDGAHDVSERYNLAPLGLQLKRVEFVVDSIVIDHIERPTEN